MTHSTGWLRVNHDGRMEVDASLRLTDRSHIWCHAYDGKPPILAINDGNVSVSVTVPQRQQVTADDLTIARRLADAVAAYITGLEQRIAAQDKEAAGRAA